MRHGYAKTQIKLVALSLIHSLCSVGIPTMRSVFLLFEGRKMIIYQNSSINQKKTLYQEQITIKPKQSWLNKRIDWQYENIVKYLIN